jgi:hypothetical protein
LSWLAFPAGALVPDKPVADESASDKAADGGETRAADSVQVPEWNKKGTLPDGRVFVTDGAIAIDALIAHVDVLPTDSLSDVQADWLQSILKTPQPAEFGCEDLEYDADRQVWKGPNVRLNPTYVTYLRATYPGDRLKFRSNKTKDPVLILVHGAVIGVLMPIDPDA